MSQATTYYDTLQVVRSANEAVIRAAYRTLSQKYHPDKNPGDPTGATKDMKRLNEAYEVLSDPNRRAEYDALIDQHEKALRDQESRTRKKSEAAKERSRSTQSSSRPSEFDNAHVTATARKREQGRSRFEQSNTGAAEAYRRGAGFTVSDRKSQPSKALRDSNGLTFWNVAVLCMIGAWVLALEGSKTSGSGHDKLSFWSLILNPGFLGMVAVPAMFLLIFAGGGWVVGWLIPSLRKGAAWVGLVLSLCTFLILWSGGQVRGPHPQNLAAAAPSPNAPPSLTVAANEQQLYQPALAEIEARHPALNPDLPGYRKDLIDEATARMKAYVSKGIARHTALRLAIADMERGANTPKAPAAQTFVPSTTNSYSQNNARALSVGEQTTIGMACGDYQMNGDVSRYQSCMREQTARAKSVAPVPSMDHLTIGEQTAIGMACGDYQMNGDIANYQNCMRSNISRATR